MGQILVQVSTLHVLGDHAEGVAAHTHAQQADDVRVLQPRQDLHLFQEVVPTTTRRNQDEGISHRKDKERNMRILGNKNQYNIYIYHFHQHSLLQLWTPVHLID